MPDLKTLKLQGTKLVPVNRFNLEASKPSTSFKGTKASNFKVIRHPIINSIQIKPLIIRPLITKEYFPIIENSQSIRENSTFKDFTDSKINLYFPEIEVIPNNNTLFYYENILDSKGQNSDLIGRITLKYIEKNKPSTPTQQNIALNLKQVVLNLKVSDRVITINGNVDTVKKEITFHLIGEAVKIAFSNLVTDIDRFKCNLDLFFDFKGYSKFKRNFIFAKDFKFNRQLLNLKPTEKSNIKRKMIIEAPLIVRKGTAKNNIKNDIRAIQVEKKLTAKNEKITPDFVKSTFLLKVNKTINYPLPNDPSKSLYKTIGGGFINHPFNLNEDFSQYQQIFVPGVNFDSLSIYKSTTTANEFLLIPKKYHISRDTDTMKPCIETIFHAYEEGTGLTEDISKINFQFAIGPNLSEFDLAKLKIDLKKNNFLDGNSINYLTDVRFIYPNEINSEYEINGNHLLQNAEITVDGKHFLISLNTENLNEASILINAINNSISQYANINFKHKEIKDTAVIDINLEKTIGEIIEIIFDEESKKINLTNVSISQCKLNSVLTIDNNNNIHYNSSLFSNYPLLDGGQSVELLHTQLNSNLASKPLKDVYFDFESIENISDEFSQIVSSSTNYNRYIQVQIQKQETDINKIQIKLTVNDTGSVFIIEKLKDDFRKPILFNFIIKNSTSLNTTIGYEVNYFDIDNNIISSKNFGFDFSTSSTIYIPNHN
ncbi:hypothetical protein LXD69_04765 [Flavobacterium sediminilitoris]|uniref:Uncharacterized protein n=1 Tax=Flavobacterium sediminilitoris TaxID=2024526 RepID=A0ABY4HQG8_9FLAO|nr:MULTISPECIES: hypothetical protein [Flavobacterium]UOX34823.1 hypothetical protein LXD69_04765 [Flavobacterium sediminilitoris]